MHQYVLLLVERLRMTVGELVMAYACVEHVLVLHPTTLRVNSIRPGLIATDMVAPILSMPELSGDYAAQTPLPRHGEVEDIANAAVFLLSDASGWITGQVINIDGGHGLRRGPDLSAMLEPVFGADGLRGVVPN